MKKVLFVLVALVMIASCVATASADGCHQQPMIYCSEGFFVPMSESYPPCGGTTTTVTTTVVTTETTVYQTPCIPPCPPPCHPAACYDPCQGAIRDALKDILRVVKDAKCLIERELMQSDWKLVSWKRPKCVSADKTGRVIRYAKFENKQTGETFACFFVVRTSETICNYVESGSRNYGAMFVSNFNTGKHAAVYEDEWLITDYSQPVGTTIVEFVEKLESGELLDTADVEG